MTAGRLRVGVIGVGHVGRHHARLLSESDEADLTAIVDIDASRASEAAALYGATVVERCEDLVGVVDAVTVAVPTEVHAEVALPLLERGLPLLIEKPLASSLAEADAIIEAAARSGTTLAVGHVERFNPAVRAAKPLVSAPRFVEVHRLAAFPERSLDIDVIFDMMIHDLDLLLSLVGSEVTSVEAFGVAVLTDRIDMANVRLRFASGCIANLTASRISRDKVRKLRFFQPDRYVSIDCAAQEVEAWQVERSPSGKAMINGGRLDVPAEEPLKVEIADFLDAVRNRRSPVVTGLDGRRALELAERIATDIRQRSAEFPSATLPTPFTMPAAVPGRSRADGR